MSKKYILGIAGVASVITYVTVEADSPEEAEALGSDPDVLMEVEWKYDGIQEVCDVFSVEANDG